MIISYNDRGQLSIGMVKTSVLRECMLITTCPGTQTVHGYVPCPVDTEIKPVVHARSLLRLEIFQDMPGPCPCKIRPTGLWGPLVHKTSDLKIFQWRWVLKNMWQKLIDVVAVIKHLLRGHLDHARSLSIRLHHWHGPV